MLKEKKSTNIQPKGFLDTLKEPYISSCPLFLFFFSNVFLLLLAVYKDFWQFFENLGLYTSNEWFFWNFHHLLALQFDGVYYVKDWMDQKEKHFDHIWTSFEIKKMCVKKCVKFVFIGCWLSSILVWSRDLTSTKWKY